VDKTRSERRNSESQKCNSLNFKNKVASKIMLVAFS